MYFRPVLRMILAHGWSRTPTRSPVTPARRMLSQRYHPVGEAIAQSPVRTPAGPGRHCAASQPGQTELRSTAAGGRDELCRQERRHVLGYPLRTPECSPGWETEHVLYDFLTSIARPPLTSSASKVPLTSRAAAQTIGRTAPSHSRQRSGSNLKSATAGLVRTQTGGSTAQRSVSLQFNNDGAEKF